MTAAETAAMQKFLEDQKQLERAMEALASSPDEALRVLPDAAGGESEIAKAAAREQPCAYSVLTD